MTHSFPTRRSSDRGVMGKVFSYVSACRPATRALYPDAQPDRSPARQHHAFAPIFLPRRPAASCSASPPRCPGREGSRPPPPAEPLMIDFGHLTQIALRREPTESSAEQRVGKEG